MARTVATNFSGALQYPYATSSTDVFHKEDVQVLAQAVDQHDHTAGKGLAVAPASANLATNGGFEVNQRGGTVTANNAFAHDRWQILLGGSSTISVTDETSIVDTGSGHALKAVYVHNANSQIDQKLDDFRGLRGRTLSLSIRVRQGSASNIRPYISDSGSRTYGTASATTGSFVTLSVSLAITAGATGVNIGIELAGSDTVYLDNAMLVIGPQAAGYVPLHPADDLARCLRYYETLGAGAGVTLLGGGSAWATNAFTFMYSYKVNKPVTPTITFNGPSAYAAGNGASVATLTSISATYSALDRAGVTVQHSGSYAVGQCGQLNAAAGFSAGIQIESNP